MALDGTYTGLKASVGDFLNRSDLTSAIPDFIVLAEAQMARRFVSRQKQGLSVPRRLVQRSDATLAQGDEYIAVPSDFVGPVALELTATPPINLDYVSDLDIQREKVAARWTSLPPKFYTVVSGELQIYPVADISYAAELTYIKRLPALSASNEGDNWVLQDYPDAYLYGALVQSAPYLKDDARTSVWGTLFAAAIDDICESDPMPTNKVTLRTDTALTRYLSPSPYTTLTNT